jgi:hypothetical protein
MSLSALLENKAVDSVGRPFPILNLGSMVMSFCG